MHQCGNNEAAQHSKLIGVVWDWCNADGDQRPSFWPKKHSEAVFQSKLQVPVAEIQADQF